MQPDRGTAGWRACFLASELLVVIPLPALPKAWPTGKVAGLRTRGVFTMDIEWQDCNVTKYRIALPEPRKIKVRVNGETKRNNKIGTFLQVKA